MAAGDKEILEVFQQTSTRNIKAVIAHSNTTRDLVRELEDKVKSLDGLVRNYDQKIEMLQQQIVVLQTKLFSGGT